MELHRLSLKLFIRDPSAVDLPAFVPVFHGWIQNEVMDKLLIDVADYKHVPDGPGIVLIGHDIDYAIDLAGGRPGLLTTHKHRPEAELSQRLRDLLRDALTGAKLLESEPKLGGRIRFGTDEMALTLVDRLRAPNTAEQFESVRRRAAPALGEVFEGAELSLERASDDPRDLLSIRVTAAGAADLDTLLRRLETSPAAAGG